MWFSLGLIAQLVERSAHNRLVLGSSPSWPTILVLFRGVVNLGSRSKRVLSSVLASMCAFTCSLAVKNVPGSSFGVGSTSNKASKRVRGKKKNKPGRGSGTVGKGNLDSNLMKKSNKGSGVSGETKTKGSNIFSKKPSNGLNKNKATLETKNFLKLENKKGQEGLSKVGKVAAIGGPILGTVALGAVGTLVGRNLYCKNLVKKSKILTKLMVDRSANADSMIGDSRRSVCFGFNGSNYEFVTCCGSEAKKYVVYGLGNGINFRDRLKKYNASAHNDGDKLRSSIISFVANKVLPKLGFKISGSEGAQRLACSMAASNFNSMTSTTWFVYNFDSGNDLLLALNLGVGDEGTIEGDPQLKVIRVE